MNGRLSSLIDLILRPQVHSLKLQAIRAAVWSLVEKGTSHVLRLLGSLILTRILYPEAFGIMATANIVIVFIQLFTDIGVRISIIQNPRGAEKEFLDTAWTISFIRGCILTAIVMVLSWPMSILYHQKQLTGILCIMALSPMILGLENPGISVTIKNFRAEKKVALEIWSQVSGLVSSIVLAWLMRSVYALAMGMVLSSLSKAVGSFVISTYRPRFILNASCAQEIIHIGKYIFVNTLISFLATNADILIIGKVLRMDDLGVYNLGKSIGTILWAISLQVFLQSYLPALSSANGDHERIVRMYERTSSAILSVCVPASMILALFSDELIRLLYDPRYQASGIAVFWFGLGGILQVQSTINSNTFIATGKIRYETLSMLAGLLFVIVFVPLGAMHYGLQGAALSMWASMVLVAAAQSVFLGIGLGFSVRKILMPWVVFLATAGIMAGAYFLLRPVLSFPSLYDAPLFGVIFLVGLACALSSLAVTQGTASAKDLFSHPVKIQQKGL